mmetsp:Transcript_3405/g.8194  ORF Transcript_3405/g.8194 Transcript_3405/m.8194 type:complete len:101 (+) Transcript_3405:38-340(+)
MMSGSYVASMYLRAQSSYVLTPKHKKVHLEIRRLQSPYKGMLVAQFNGTVRLHQEKRKPFHMQRHPQTPRHESLSGWELVVLKQWSLNASHGWMRISWHT